MHTRRVVCNVPVLWPQVHQMLQQWTEGKNLTVRVALMSHQHNGPWYETWYGLRLSWEGTLVKTVSLPQPEASQARTSCGELCAKKRRRGEGNGAEHNATGDRGVQCQTARVATYEMERGQTSLFYLEQVGYLHHSSSPRIMLKPDDSKSK